MNVLESEHQSFMSMCKKFFFLFIVLIQLSCKTDVKRIGIQPLGKVNAIYLDSIQKVLSEFYSREVVILPAKAIPPSTFINVKSPRYRADSLIYNLRKTKPDSIDIVLGVLASDISITKKDDSGKPKMPSSKYADWGIMGLGFCPGKSSIVSTFRLDQNNKPLFMERMKKISAHEVGHNFGLKHCKSEFCVMRDAAESIQTIDKVNLALCDDCKRKIN